MAIVNVYVNKRIASVDAGLELVCNNPTDTINFVFDEEWAAYPSKIATFAWDGGYQDVAFIGNQVQTPEIFNTNYVYVGVYADGIASTPAKVNCKRSILCIRGNKRSVPGHADFTEFMKAAQEVADCSERLSAAENDIDALENYEKRPFELIGNPIQMQNFEGMPLNVVTAFEPKQEGSGDPSPDNVRPIGGYDALSLVRCGKNLLPFGDGNWTIQSGVEWYSPYISIPALLPFNEKLKASVAFTDGTAFTSGGAVLVLRDSALNAIKTTGFSSGEIMTLTKEEAEKIKVWSLYFNEGGIALSAGKTVAGVQLEVGTVSTAFEPYQGDSYSVQIGQTIYGGRMDWMKGELLVEYEKIVLDGVNMGVVTVWENALYACTNFIGRGLRMPKVGAKGACSHFPVNSKAVGSDSVHFSHDNSGSVYIGAIPGVNGADAYNAYLQTNPITCVYELQEPFTIQLTPNDIAALDGINTIYGDGEITVSGRKDILWLTSDLIERIKTLEEAIVSLGGNV